MPKPAWGLSIHAPSLTRKHCASTIITLTITLHIVHPRSAPLFFKPGITFRGRSRLWVKVMVSFEEGKVGLQARARSSAVSVRAIPTGWVWTNI